MRIFRTFTFRIVLAVLFVIGIVVSLARFTSENRERITAQNEEYITELTNQGVKSLDNMLVENLGFIKSTAYLYGESLTSPWADVAVIRDYEENSVFDRLCFIDESGDNYTGRGVIANLADRDYFQDGMNGGAGIADTEESDETGEGALGFYAPVYYEGRVIGVMTGFYTDAFIRDTLEYSLFGHSGTGWLCASDGTVVGSTLKDRPDNILNYLSEEKNCPMSVLERVSSALTEQKTFTFSYPDNGSLTIAYGKSLTRMPWTMIRDFPSSASDMLVDSANRSVTKLVTALIIMFLVLGALFAIGLIIDLKDKRRTIMSTERDPLTKLYNRQYFYHYVDLFDQHHKSMEMDAVLFDADHFQMINERYGRVHGDEVLKRIADALLEEIHKTGGVLCRREADVFMMYCPHRDDYGDLLEKASVRLTDDSRDLNRVRLRLGIYSMVDKSIEPVRRFDMAKTAADTIRGTYHTQIAFYDETILKKELYEDQLISDFDEAVKKEQFHVYLQPKFDVRYDQPFASGAEALVRWQHPSLGLLSPAQFIPLFEANGLIRRLDTYVWEHTAILMQDWKRRLGRTLPVSVNISRVDMYDPELTQQLVSLIKRYGLTTDDLRLEITESAYAEDSVRIIDTARQLRDAGFKIEMDDFGTGYSSLNMINDLPVDVLKLDMAFVRAAFRDGKDTGMLRIIIDIGRYLGVPVIAEGVETLEQMETLRKLGCDYIQGYYFSKPIPAAEFERFIRKDASVRDLV